MKIEYLNYVIEIDYCKSFNKAASKLYISQPSLSKAIQSLESELGIKIFERSTKGVETTLEGKKLISHAKKMLLDFKFLQKDLHEKGEQVYTSNISTYVNRYSIKAYSKFCKEILNKNKNKNINLTLNMRNNFDIVEDVFSKISDMGILLISNLRYDFWMNVFQKKDIEFVPLKELEIYILVGSKSRLSQKEKIEIKDLVNYPHVIYNGVKSSGADYNFEYSTEYNIMSLNNTKKIFQVDDRELLFDLINELDGYCLGIIDNCEYLNKKNIYSIPIANNNLFLTLGYIKLKSTDLDKYANIFIECLNSVVNE